MHLKTLCLLFLIPFINYGQSEIFLDENKKPINEVVYKKKCESHITKCLDYITDSLIIHKISYKYTFGKINEPEFNRVKSLLSNKAKKKIDSNTTIMVKFSDTLQSLGILKANYDKHVLTCNATHDEKNLKNFRDDRTEWVKAKKKCINKLENKNNVSVNYVYKFDKNALQSYNNFQWIIDDSTFKNMFFKNMYAYNLVILKPNGEYFLSGSHLSDKSLSKLIQTDDWSQYKRDWESSITTHVKKGKGFFNNSFTSHKSHCF